MRFYEFIVEYKTEITKGNYGQKILNKIGLPTIVQTKRFPLSMYENDYTLGALDLMGVAINPIDNSPDLGAGVNLTPENYEQHKGEIIDWLIRQFEYFDPTPNKQYTQFIVKWFLNAKNLNPQDGFPSIEDGLSTLRQSLGDFNRMKERLPERYRDIAQYTSAKVFMHEVQHFKRKYGKEEKLPKGQIKIIYDDPKYAKAYWAVDEAGACYLGQGTQWCTASTRSANYFDQYDAKGPLLIFHMKKEIQYNLQDDYEDDGGHFHAEYAEDTSTFQATLKVDSRGDWLFGDGDIAAPDDTEIDFSDLYDYNSHFKAMYDSQEFQNAMTNVAKEWMKTTDHVAGAWDWP